MRYIRYAVLATVIVVMVLLALANREWVTMRLLPEELAEILGVTAWNSVQAPLFSLLFVGILIGALFGLLREYVREHRIRRDARRGRRENAQLTREVAQMKRDRNQGDEVLALLDDRG